MNTDVPSTGSECKITCRYSNIMWKCSNAKETGLSLQYAILYTNIRLRAVQRKTSVRAFQIAMHVKLIRNNILPTRTCSGHSVRV